MIRPLRNLLYIIPIRDREKIGSIYIPETAQQRPDQGIVKYRGPQTSGEIKRGDHVIFSGYDDSSQIVTEDDGLLYVIPEDFIVGVHENAVASYVFTKEQLAAFFDIVEARTIMHHNNNRVATDAAAYMKEQLHSIVGDNLFNELVF